ncbi:unnamed protein product [Arabidopsis thaliana]|uniref:Uncharacterized protein n=1 Tax=Arabidopsis thaliana TaxID=3702 RepID=A0A654G4K2_ARATH|nr:unnamed protein product [Arabidopsis thaliana]
MKGEFPVAGLRLASPALSAALASLRLASPAPSAALASLVSGVFVSFFDGLGWLCLNDVGVFRVISGGIVSFDGEG